MDKFRVTFIYNSNGWGYYGYNTEFVGYFDTCAEAKADAKANNYIW